MQHVRGGPVGVRVFSYTAFIAKITEGFTVSQSRMAGRSVRFPFIYQIMSHKLGERP